MKKGKSGFELNYTNLNNDDQPMSERSINGSRYTDQNRFKSENNEMQKLRELAQQFQKRRASQAVKPVQNMLDYSSKLAHLAKTNENKSDLADKNIPIEDERIDKVSQNKTTKSKKLTEAKSGQEEVKKEVVVMSKEEHKKLLDQLQRLQQLEMNLSSNNQNPKFKQENDMNQSFGQVQPIEEQEVVLDRNTEGLKPKQTVDDHESQIYKRDDSLREEIKDQEYLSSKKLK